MKPRYTATVTDTLLSVAAAPIVIAPMVFVLIVIGALDVGDPHLVQDLVQGARGATAFIWIVCVGLWLPFHFSGHRHWAFALLVGFLACFFGCLGQLTQMFSMPLAGRCLDGQHPHCRYAYTWADAAAPSLMVALLGCALGGAMWRIAYRKETNSVAPH